MSILKVAIFREKARNEKMISEYIKELELLPKGKVVPKTRKNKTYYYLYYREGKTIISKYIGKDKDSLKELYDKLVRRSQIEAILKKLKKEKRQIEKMEGIL